jgi:hypothetical protein
MKTKLARLVREIDERDVIEVCRALRLDDDETASVLARHSQSPELLELVLALGGNLADFVEGRVEIRRAIRSAR